MSSHSSRALCTVWLALVLTYATPISIHAVRTLRRARTRSAHAVADPSRNTHITSVHQALRGAHAHAIQHKRPGIGIFVRHRNTSPGSAAARSPRILLLFLYLRARARFVRACAGDGEARCGRGRDRPSDDEIDVYKCSAVCKCRLASGFLGPFWGGDRPSVESILWSPIMCSPLRV